MQGLQQSVAYILFTREKLFLAYILDRCTPGAVKAVFDRLEKRLGIFDFLTQWDVNLIVNHMNSTPRESPGGKTPYSLALEHYGEDVLNALQLKRIDPDEVCHTPELIRFTHH